MQAYIVIYIARGIMPGSKDDKKQGGVVSAQAEATIVAYEAAAVKAVAEGSLEKLAETEGKYEGSLEKLAETEGKYFQDHFIVAKYQRKQDKEKLARAKEQGDKTNINLKQQELQKAERYYNAAMYSIFNDVDIKSAYENQAQYPQDTASEEAAEAERKMPARLEAAELAQEEEEKKRKAEATAKELNAKKAWELEQKEKLERQAAAQAARKGAAQAAVAAQAARKGAEKAAAAAQAAIERAAPAEEEESSLNNLLRVAASLDVDEVYKALKKGDILITDNVEEELELAYEKARKDVLKNPLQLQSVKDVLQIITGDNLGKDQSKNGTIAVNIIIEAIREMVDFARFDVFNSLASTVADDNPGTVYRGIVSKIIGKAAAKTDRLEAAARLDLEGVDKQDLRIGTAKGARAALRKLMGARAALGDLIRRSTAKTTNSDERNEWNILRITAQEEEEGKEAEAEAAKGKLREAAERGDSGAAYQYGEYLIFEGLVIGDVKGVSSEGLIKDLLSKTKEALKFFKKANDDPKYTPENPEELKSYIQHCNDFGRNLSRLVFSSLGIRRDPRGRRARASTVVPPPRPDAPTSFEGYSDVEEAPAGGGVAETAEAAAVVEPVVRAAAQVETAALASTTEVAVEVGGRGGGSVAERIAVLNSKTNQASAGSLRGETPSTTATAGPAAGAQVADGASGVVAEEASTAEAVASIAVEAAQPPLAAPAVAVGGRGGVGGVSALIAKFDTSSRASAGSLRGKTLSPTGVNQLGSKLKAAGEGQVNNGGGSVR
jgi:hypothetical protein